MGGLGVGVGDGGRLCSLVALAHGGLAILLILFSISAWTFPFQNMQLTTTNREKYWWYGMGEFKEDIGEWRGDNSILVCV
jgi:hypothetical protein